MTLHLWKLHATGNDFLVHRCLDGRAALEVGLVVALCDRHRGIGADGLLTLGPGAAGADCSMTLVNADGGPAEMSGNGIRCLAFVAARSGLGDERRLVVDTAGGRRVVDLRRDGSGDVVAAEVDMGAVTFEPARIPLDAPRAADLEATVDGTTYRGDAVGVGNPHLVVLVDDPATVPVARDGPQLEHDARFPNRTNVEFVAPAGPDALAMRVWERGVGETLSCGTGACAAAAVAHRRGLVGSAVTVTVPGGVLRVELGAETARLAGPVQPVFEVDVDPARLRPVAGATSGDGTAS